MDAAKEGTAWDTAGGGRGSALRSGATARAEVFWGGFLAGRSPVGTSRLGVMSHHGESGSHWHKARHQEGAGGVHHLDLGLSKIRSSTRCLCNLERGIWHLL